ncbi:hypothetical protein FTO70_04975 [Methanosarcina sp. KYL-1]|uniref:hypothetical protein n=1 Tax=Methanosarcina sp. KYL-1 TaxID=2602068 RepID=UPI00210102D1|nr:hypothetical protein [Methanosarcina sp. KYL-1]MCQ1535049.1 hypothetical protein [Methanosarcina sp. KYL-1]
MRSGFVLILCFLFCLQGLSLQASAVSLNLELDAVEYLNDLVFYQDGTHSCGNVIGYLSVTNPSLNHTVSSIDISFSDGITPSGTYINELGPNSTAIVSYELPGSDTVPLPSVSETVEPSSLYQGVEQEIVFRVDISNPGSESLDLLTFDRAFPEQLEFVGYTLSAGKLNRTGNSFLWEDFSISPGSEESLRLVFKTVPTSDLVLQPSNFSFTVPAFAASRDLSLSAVTSTRFAVEKQKVGEGEWKVGVVVEDASEFDCSLYGVEVYVSDTGLNETKLIRDYALDLNLRPGESWRDFFTYEYSGTPVFFAKVYYTIPYTISGSSMPLDSVEGGGFVINSIVSGDSGNSSTPLDSGETGDNVLDPAVPDENEDRHHDGDSRRLTIIKTILPAPEQEPESPEAVSQNEEGDAPRRDEMKDTDTFTLLMPLLVGLAVLTGRKLLPFVPFFKKKRIAVSSSSVEKIYASGGLELLFSGRREAVISRNEFGKLELTGLLEALGKTVAKGRIKVIDTELSQVREIMERYGILSEDAEILAAAAACGIKPVLVISPSGRLAAQEMGLKPVELSDLLSPEKPEPSL